MCCIFQKRGEQGELSIAIGAGDVNGVHDALRLALPAEKKVALNRASRMGLDTIVSLLLDSGVDVHEDSDALQWASRYGHASTAKLLLERGADVNAMHGEALRLAERFGHQDVRALLLEHQTASSQKRL